MLDAGLRKSLRHRTCRSDTLGREFSSWYLSARWRRGITGRSSGRLRRPLSLFVKRRETWSTTSKLQQPFSRSSRLCQLSSFFCAPPTNLSRCLGTTAVSSTGLGRTCCLSWYPLRRNSSLSKATSIARSSYPAWAGLCAVRCLLVSCSLPWVLGMRSHASFNWSAQGRQPTVIPGLQR